MTKNRRVSLYIYSKVGGSWKYRPAPERPKNLPEGSSFVMMWYEGEAEGKARKRLKNVGRVANVAQIEITKKKAELLNRIAEGKDTPEPVAPEPIPAPEAPPQSSSVVGMKVAKFLENCQDRCGNDGYGFAKTSLSAYKNRLRILTEFGGAIPLADVDEEFFRLYRKFLREYKRKNGQRLSDRSAHNAMQAACTMFAKNKIYSGKEILGEMHFAPKPCRPYTDEELTKFFTVCDEKESLLFKFFLFSGCRELEAAHTEVGDLNFATNVLHISPKPHRKFRLKGKKGNAALGRKVPLPAALMRQLEAHCKGKKPRDLLFPNGDGNVEYHYLRICQKIAKRAGLTGFELHRWRKTFATRSHEGGASVRKVQSWLGHTDLDTTLIYLGVQDSADESSQEFVNNSPLAAMYA